MVNFHVQAANFCSSSEVISSKCVQKITEEGTKLKAVNLKTSGRCISMAYTYFPNASVNNLHYYTSRYADDAREAFLPKKEEEIK
jgi:hypothetical protein